MYEKCLWLILILPCRVTSTQMCSRVRVCLKGSINLNQRTDYGRRNNLSSFPDCRSSFLAQFSQDNRHGNAWRFAMGRRFISSNPLTREAEAERVKYPGKKETLIAWTAYFLSNGELIFHIILFLFLSIIYVSVPLLCSSSWHCEANLTSISWRWYLFRISAWIIKR